MVFTTFFPPWNRETQLLGKAGTRIFFLREKQRNISRIGSCERYDYMMWYSEFRELHKPQYCKLCNSSANASQKTKQWQCTRGSSLPRSLMNRTSYTSVTARCRRCCRLVAAWSGVNIGRWWLEIRSRGREQPYWCSWCSRPHSLCCNKRLRPSRSLCTCSRSDMYVRRWPVGKGDMTAFFCIA